MLSDFEFVTHNFPQRETIKIYPIADVHLGAAEHLQDEWESFCAKIASEENSYVILAGDLLNNAVKNSVSNIYDELLRPREQKRKMVEMLTPIRDKILCSVCGNHERRSSREVDDDMTYDIMAKLDLEDLYRENMAFLRLRFGNNRSCGETNPTYIIVVTHGAGGGALTGGSANRAERFAYVFDGADALITAHTHKPYITQPAKIKIDSSHDLIAVRPFKVISATSWLNYGGYAAQKMLTPSSFAPQIMTLKGDKKEIKITM